MAVQNGVCRVLAINTTTEAVEFEASPQKIFPYDRYEFPGEDSTGSEPEAVPNDLHTHLTDPVSERMEQLLRSPYVHN